MDLTSIPRPLRDFLARAEELERDLFPGGLTAEALAANLEKGRSGRRDVLNYGYSLLGAGTLLVRFLAVILLRRYLTTLFETDPSPVFHRRILENLHDRQPLDSNWAAVIDAACTVLDNDSWSIVRDAAALNATEVCVDGGRFALFQLFVIVRNAFAHERLPENAEILREYLLHLKQVAEGLSLFEGSRFEEMEGILFFVDSAGERLSLHPFVRAGESSEQGVIIPYIFQGLYEGRSVLRLLGTAEGDQVEPSVWPEFSDEFRRLGRQALGMQSRFDFKPLMDRYLAMFVGREEETGALLDFCSGRASERYLAVHASPGMGKSALLASLVKRLENEKHPVIYHFCGSGEANNPLSVLAGLLDRGRKGIEGVSFWAGQSDALQRRRQNPPGSYDPMVTLFQDTLQAYVPAAKHAGKKLIIVIDGVDQALVSYPDLPLSAIFTRKEKADTGERHVPFDVPDGVRIIFGYRSGRYTDVQRSVEIPSVQPLAPLKADSVDQAFADLAITAEVKSALLEMGRLPSSSEQTSVDPSYLRFVYDEMAAGRVSGSNAATLPRGLVGLFERSLFLAEPVLVRSRRMRVLTAFALAQREIPISLVAAVLGEEDDYVRDVVEEYAAWFSAAPGKRIGFYHERLRLFLLQRVSERELLDVNQLFVTFCRKWRDLDEPEDRAYAFEFLVRHLSVQAGIMETRPYPRSLNGNPYELELCDLVLDHSFRDAQVRAMGAYNQPIQDAGLALEHVVRATAGLAGDQIDAQHCIETGNLPYLCRLVLHTGETNAKAQNDLGMVAQWARDGLIEQALERVPAVHVERNRFMLYLQILWEVLASHTIATSQKKEDCERVMRHIDGNLPPGTGSVELGGLGFTGLAARTVAELILLGVDAGPLIGRSSSATQLAIIRGLVARASALQRSAGRDALLEATLSVARGLPSSFSYRARAWDSLAERLAVFDWAGKKAMLESVLVQMFEPAPGHERLAALALSLARIGEIDRAMEAAEAIDRPGPRAMAIGRIAGVIGGQRKADHAAWFDRLIEAAQSIKAPAHRMAGLSGIVHALLAIGDRQKAAGILADLATWAESKRPHGAAGLGAIAGAFAAFGEASRAKSIFVSALDAVDLIEPDFGDEHIWNPRDDTEPGDDEIPEASSEKADALCAIAHSLAKARFRGRTEIFERAMTMARWLQDDDEAKRAQTGIAEALALCGDFDRSLKCVEAQQDSQKPQILRAIVVAIASLTSSDLREEGFRRARVVVASLRDRPRAEEAALRIAGAVASIDELEGKDKMLVEALIGVSFERLFKDTRASSEIMGNLPIGAVLNLAQPLLAERLRYDAPGNEDLSVEIADVIKRLGGAVDSQRAKPEEAMAAIESMDDAAEKAAALCDLAEGFTASEELDFAKRALSRASEDAESIKEPAVKIEALSRIASVYAIASSSEEAEALFARALTALASEIRVSWLRLKPLLVVAGHLRSVGDFGGKRALIERLLIALPQVDFVPMDEENRWEEDGIALRTIAAIGDLSKDLRALGVPGAGNQMLESALVAAQDIDLINFKLEALYAIGSAFENLGEMERARAILLEALSEIDLVPDRLGAAILAADIAASLHAVGDRPGAEEACRIGIHVAGKISLFLLDPADKAAALLNLIRVIGKLGLSETTRHLLDRAELEVLSLMPQASATAALMEIAGVRDANGQEALAESLLSMTWNGAASIENAQEQAETVGEFVDGVAGLLAVRQREGRGQSAGALARLLECWQHARSFRFPAARQLTNRWQNVPGASFSQLIRSLLWCPDDLSTAHNGIKNVIYRLSGTGQSAVLMEIARACPELGLPSSFSKPASELL